MRSFFICLLSLISSLFIQSHCFATYSHEEIRELADELYEEGWYGGAIEYYNLYLEKEKLPEHKNEIFYKLGLSYLELNEYAKSIETLSRIEKEAMPKLDFINYFWIAENHKTLGNKEDALRFYNLYTENTSIAKNKRMRELAQANSQLFSIPDTTASIHFISDQKSNEYSHHQPFNYHDSLLFFIKEHTIFGDAISVELTNVLVKVTDYRKGEIYSFIQNNSFAGIPKKSSIKKLNDLEEVSLSGFSITADQQRIYYSACRGNQCRIYFSEKSGNDWGQPYIVTGDVNDFNSSNKNPYVTTNFDGSKIMYFTSNRKGGQGGWDLYYGLIDAKDHVSDIRNLGEVINTPLDEENAYFEPITKNLYFSSNGHPNYGGSDIFLTQIANNHLNAPIIHLSNEINSAYNEDGLYLNTDKKEGYVASNRVSASNKVPYFNHIYQFDVAKALDFQNLYVPTNNNIEYATNDGKNWFWITNNNDAIEISGSDKTQVYLLSNNDELIDACQIHQGKCLLTTVPSKSNMRLVVSQQIQNIKLNNTEIDPKCVSLVKNYSPHKTPDIYSHHGYEILDTNGLNSFRNDSSITRITANLDPYTQLFIFDSTGSLLKKGMADNNGILDLENFFLPKKSIIWIEHYIAHIKVHLLDSLGETVQIISPASHPALFEFGNIPFKNTFQTLLNQNDQRLISIPESKMTFSCNIKSHFELIIKDNKNNIIDTASSITSNKLIYHDFHINQAFLVETDVVNKSLINSCGFILDEKWFSVSVDQVINFKNNENSIRKQIAFEIGDTLHYQMYSFVKSVKDSNIYFMVHEANSTIQGNASAGSMIYIEDEQKRIVGSAQTDPNGNFQFKKIPTNTLYRMVTGTDDGSFKNLNIINPDGLQAFIDETFNIFSYKNIERLKSENSFMSINDESSFIFDADEKTFSFKKLDANTDLLFLDFEDGSLIGKTNPLTQVGLVSHSDNSITWITSDKHGNFAFRRLNSHEGYYLIIDSDDNNEFLHFEIKDKTGKIVMSTNGDIIKIFQYKNIAPNQKSNKHIFSVTDHSSFIVNDFSIKDEQKNGRIIFSSEEIFSILGRTTPNTSVYLDLLDKNKSVKVIANERGEFNFRNLPPHNKYYLHLFKDAQGNFIDIQVVDFYGQIVNDSSLSHRTTRFFNYHQINPDNAKKYELPAVDQSTYDFAELEKRSREVLVTFVKLKNGAQGFIFGNKNYTIEGTTTPNTNVALISEDENKEMWVKSDENGHFKFRRLNADHPYHLSLESDDPNALKHLTIINEYGYKKVIEIASMRRFAFSKLPISNSSGYKTMSIVDHSSFFMNHDWLTVHEQDNIFYIHSDELIDIIGKTSPNTHVYLENEKNIVITKVIADDHGLFAFKKIDPNHRYHFILASEDGTILKKLQLNLYDHSQHEIIAERLYAMIKKAFSYKKIDPSYDEKITMFHLNDNTFDFSEVHLLIEHNEVSNNYFTVNNDKMYIKGQSEKNNMIFLMDELGSMLAVVKCDEKGNFRFNKLPQNKKFKLMLETKDENDFLQFEILYDGANSIYAFNPRTDKNVVEYANVKEKYTYDEVTKVLESDLQEGNIKLIDEIEFFVKFVHGAEDYQKFIHKYQHTADPDIHYRIQLVAVKYTPTQFTAQVKKKGFEEIVVENAKNNIKIVMVGKAHTLNKIEEVRSQLNNDYKKYHPFIEVYYAGSRKFHLIEHN